MICWNSQTLLVTMSSPFQNQEAFSAAPSLPLEPQRAPQGRTWSVSNLFTAFSLSTGGAETGLWDSLHSAVGGGNSTGTTGVWKSPQLVIAGPRSSRAGDRHRSSMLASVCTFDKRPWWSLGRPSLLSRTLCTQTPSARQRQQHHPRGSKHRCRASGSVLEALLCQRARRPQASAP